MPLSYPERSLLNTGSNLARPTEKSIGNTRAMSLLDSLLIWDIDMVKQVSRMHIPRGYLTEYIPGLDEDSTDIYGRYTKEVHFSEDTAMLGDLLTSQLSQTNDLPTSPGAKRHCRRPYTCHPR